MKCPFCKKDLVAGEQRQFETLADHVSEPNAEWYPFRPTWICDCELGSGSFWSDDGGFYLGRELSREKRLKLIRIEKTSAIGSIYDEVGW